MTAKSASSIPHDHRLISCYEAAKLLGCTPQTIYNWIKKGKLKGYKIDNHIFVGKKAIGVLFDTATDVARMKESLKLHKKELKTEIKNRDEAIIAELREENKMLRSKTDNLTEEVENLRAQVKELSTTRKIQNTPFDTDNNVEAIIKTECELRDRVSKLENLLSDTRNQLYKKNSKIESLERNLKIAKEKMASQKGSILALRKANNNSKQLKAEIESLNKKLQSRDKRGYAIFEHKEATLKTWIKGLEEDLASKRDYIKSLEIAQKELQEENAKLKAQVAEQGK